MPDIDRTPDAFSSDWSGAFAALPMEAPPADGWQRVNRALDARSQRDDRRRGRWPVWLAAAAAVSAVALVPVLMRDTAPTNAPAMQVATQSQAPVARPASSTSPMSETQTRSADPTVPAVSPSNNVEATAQAPSHTPRKRRPSPTTPPHDAEPRRLVASATSAPEPAAVAPSDTDNRNALAMQSLQAESAQLEALVAMARDDRVVSANGAALTVEFDERIGRIDASLSQPALGDGDRLALWQERVAVMRELAGIESTQRWITANGERYDGALVSVD